MIFSVIFRSFWVLWEERINGERCVQGRSRETIEEIITIFQQEQMMTWTRMPLAEVINVGMWIYFKDRFDGIH